MNFARKTFDLLVLLLALYACVETALCHSVDHKPKQLIRLEEAQNLSPSCSVSVCFGIDGGILTSAQVKLQRNFFKDLLEFLSQKVEVKVSAVEYGAANRRLFRLTSNLSEAIDVAANLAYRGDELSSVSSSIVYCDSVLRSEENRKVRIVLFSSGKNNLGGSPSHRADIFRMRTDGDVIVISLAHFESNMFKDITANNTGDIFLLESDEYNSLLRDVTDRVCE
eukprot:TRINITY_DN6883_c0_g1_i1.p1 TRINITY_DN6883_c0_g1~~TRINITY_DN6883_c0_g1_i1.p1  ORF type:complete len:224 (-),score=30.17 TRINITY_DN6883_c0_g1_i1:2018-2689(-)